MLRLAASAVVAAACLAVGTFYGPEIRALLPGHPPAHTVRPEISPPRIITESRSESREVHFSPHGGCTEAVVRELGTAKKTVLVQAYSFTSAPIAEALVAAHRRGVEVQVILDKSQRSERYSSADFVAHADIPTLIDAKHAIAHNKVMIIDGETVITGSFNFTKAAENSNAENLLVLHDPKLAATYTENWEAHKGHSEPYVGR